MTVDHKNWSSIIPVEKSELMNGISKKRLLRKDAVYRISIRSSNERIHQLTSTSDQSLLFACTARNSIVKVNPMTKATEEIVPFTDKFDKPIRSDHNHINSAIEYGGKCFFVAYRAGDSSCIGCIDKESVYGWFEKPVGFHDLYETSSGFVSFDTFGYGKGRILTESGEYLSKVTEQGTGYVLRGAAGDLREWVIGHSHKGPRSKRYKGNGGVVVVGMDESAQYIELPVSQVYQVRRVDGRFFDSREGHDLVQSLVRRFGAPEWIGECLRVPDPGEDRLKPG